jgi:hypothetical protein
MQACRPDGIPFLFREVLRMRRIDTDKVLKTDEEIAAEAEAAQQAAQAEQQGGAQPQAEPRPDTESQMMRAQADMIRANAQADRVRLEGEKVSISRAEAVAKIRKAQQEIAASRVAPVAGAEPPMAAPQTEAMA